jgi:hypothetical protein
MLGSCLHSGEAEALRVRILAADAKLQLIADTTHGTTFVSAARYPTVSSSRFPAVFTKFTPPGEHPAHDASGGEWASVNTGACQTQCQTASSCPDAPLRQPSLNTVEVNVQCTHAPLADIDAQLAHARQHLHEAVAGLHQLQRGAGHRPGGCDTAELFQFFNQHTALPHSNDQVWAVTRDSILKPR